MKVNRKVVLTGYFGVGKTSLFCNFIKDTFVEKYTTTLSAKIDRKVVLVDGEKVNINLWDIAGEISQDKIPKSYFIGTSAVIYVIDLTRPITYEKLAENINILRNRIPNVMIKIVGNKKDLLLPKELDSIQATLNLPIDIFTSAKTRENVEELFESLARSFLITAWLIIDNLLQVASWLEHV